MPRIKLDQLGESGLVVDIHPTQLPPNAVNILENALCEHGTIRNVGGELKLFDLAIKPLYHFVYNIPGEENAVYVISDGRKIYAYSNDGSYIDLLENMAEGSEASGGEITFTVLNGILVLNSQTDGCWYWDISAGPTDPKLKRLPGWDPTWRAKRVIAYKYYLVAVGIKIGEQEYPYMIAWSNSADPGSVPTSWETLATNDAGTNNIADTPGKIVTAVTVGNALWICKEDSIYNMVWVGGQHIFQITKLTGVIGTRLIRGITEFAAGLAIIGAADIYYFDGVNVQSLVSGKIKDKLFERIGSDQWKYAQLFTSQRKSKLLMSTPVSGADGRLYDLFIFDSFAKTWSYKYLYYGYGFDEGFISTIMDDEIVWDTLDQAIANPHESHESAGTNPAVYNNNRWFPGLSWDSQNEGSWDKGLYDPFEKQIIFYKSNPEDTVWWCEIWHPSFYTDAANNPIISKIGRTGISFAGTERVGMIKDVWIELTGTIEDAKFYIGIQKAMESNIILDGPYVVKPNETIKFSPRLTGRFFGWGMVVEKVGNWQLASITVDYTPAGER